MQRYTQGRTKKSLFPWLEKLLFSLKQTKKKTLLKNAVLGLFAAFLLFVIFAGGIFAWYAKDLPNPNAILERDVPQSTKIYDRTGTHLLYEIALEEKRTLLPINEIPDIVQKATITAEDRDFYKHSGFSFRGFARSVFRYAISFGRVKQGGSTITQQFVKNAILTNEKRVSRKIKELILSLAIEQIYTKDQILQLYLNEIPYGSTNYGIESAAQSYFSKHAKDLTLPEAATLAAIPQLPTVYLNNPDRLKERRDWILQGMADEGYISQEQADEALKTDTPVTINVGHIEAPHFVMYVKSQLEEKYGSRLVETGGLKVTTSLDFDKQVAAEAAVENGVKARGERYGFTGAGLIALDPKTGQVVSMVGSPDYFSDEHNGQVNTTLQPLQPGSSIKPIVYAAAFEKGYTPNTLLWDADTLFPQGAGLPPYEPHNYSGNDNGIVTMRKALQGSLNIAAVKTLYLVGIDNAVKFMQRLGYSNEYDPSSIGLSMVLGGIQVTPIEHAAAYATFADNGIYHEPVSILKVEEPNGNVLEEWKEDEHKGEQVIDKNLAATMSNVLSDNNARSFVFGTSNSLVLPGRPAAAKTGTTNEYKDAWTMGYTPSLVAGVWVGNANGTKMKGAADGSVVAAPIWNEFMRTALTGTAAESFPQASIPSTGKAVLDGKIPGTAVTIDTASGKLATELTPDRFKKDVVCGEYHSILYYVDRKDPTGSVPGSPEKDPQFSSWEKSVTDYIQKHNANLKEGEKPLENCEVPTERDDVHIPQNTPSISIISPNQNESLGRTFAVRLNIALRRNFGRIEYKIDGAYVGSSGSLDGGYLTLPGWVTRGDHTFTATVYDDVDNAASSSINVTIAEDGSLGQLRITNPFNNQTIERSQPQYSVAIEVPHAGDITNVTLTAKNLWTGAESVLGVNESPSAITSITWNLPEAGDYILEAKATTKTLDLQEATPITVYVRDVKPSTDIDIQSTLTSEVPL